MLVSGWALRRACSPSHSDALRAYGLRLPAELVVCVVSHQPCASMLAYNNAHTLSYGGYAFGSLGGAARQLIWKETSLSHRCCACIFTFLMAPNFVSVIYTVVIKNKNRQSWRRFVEEFSTF